MKLVLARPGQTLESFAAELVMLAWLENAAILGSFNQFTLMARPGFTRDDVMEPARREEYKHRFGRYPDELPSDTEPRAPNGEGDLF